MFISTHNWMRPEPLEISLKRAQRLGIQSLEIAGEPGQYPVELTRALLKKYGVTCWGAVTLTMGRRNLAAKDPGQRAETVAYMKSVVDMVVVLGGSEVSVVPATVGKIIPDGTPQDEWRWVVAGLREVYAHAQARGIRLGLEPLNRFETYFLNRHDQALALAAEVGPECGVCLDAFHMNMEEADLLGAIRAVGKKLVDFHVAENNRTAPGYGSLDWKRIVETLHSVGYTGGLTLEHCPSVDRTPVSPWPGQVENNPEGVTAEQLRFIQDHGSSLVSDAFYTDQFEKAVGTLRPIMASLKL